VCGLFAVKNAAGKRLTQKASSEATLDTARIFVLAALSLALLLLQPFGFRSHTFFVLGLAMRAPRNAASTRRLVSAGVND
jgi:hypothetical protein